MVSISDCYNKRTSCCFCGKPCSCTIKRPVLKRFSLNNTRLNKRNGLLAPLTLMAQELLSCKPIISLVQKLNGINIGLLKKKRTCCCFCGKPCSCTIKRPASKLFSLNNT